MQSSQAETKAAAPVSRSGSKSSGAVAARAARSTQPVSTATAKTAGARVPRVAAPRRLHRMSAGVSPTTTTRSTAKPRRRARLSAAITRSSRRRARSPKPPRTVPERGWTKGSHRSTARSLASAPARKFPVCSPSGTPALARRCTSSAAPGRSSGGWACMWRSSARRYRDAKRPSRRAVAGIPAARMARGTSSPSTLPTKLMSSNRRGRPSTSVAASRMAARPAPPECRSVPSMSKSTRSFMTGPYGRQEGLPRSA